MKLPIQTQPIVRSINRTAISTKAANSILISDGIDDLGCAAAVLACTASITEPWTFAACMGALPAQCKNTNFPDVQTGSDGHEMQIFHPSDRNIKDNFLPVNVQEILLKVAQLPIETWNYKEQDPAIRHIGPMAQDFAAAFSVGESDKLINGVDAQGVTLAALQALYQICQNQGALISALRADLSDLQQQISDSSVHKSLQAVR